MRSGGDTGWLRRTNLVGVVRELRHLGVAGLSDISSSTGLSRPTVERLVMSLVKDGWVTETPALADGVGRPGRRFEFRASAALVVGVDVGAYSIRAAVADLDGTVVGKAEIQVDPNAGRAVRMEAIRSAMMAALDRAGREPSQIDLVCVGTPGIVSEGTVRLSTAIPEWTGADLATEISAWTGCQTIVENDTNLATVAEKWRGVATEIDDLAFVMAGARTGAGLLSRGVLLKGFHGAAGEIGALELLGWHRAPQHFTSFSHLPAGITRHESAGWVMRAARDGDADAKAAVESYTKDLAEGIAAIALLLDPEVVVLGGGASRSADVLIEPLRRHLEPLCIDMPTIMVSSLGDQAVITGAIRRAIDNIEDRLYDADGLLATGTD